MEQTEVLKPRTLADLIRILHQLFAGDEVNAEEVQAIMEAYESDPAEWAVYAKFDQYSLKAWRRPLAQSEEEWTWGTQPKEAGSGSSGYAAPAARPFPGKPRGWHEALRAPRPQRRRKVAPTILAGLQPWTAGRRQEGKATARLRDFLFSPLLQTPLPPNHSPSCPWPREQCPHFKPPLTPGEEVRRDRTQVRARLAP
ncbi:hypothetical protein P7K49_005088 [Saguinus oedipus]|uniref:Cysteine dioxygenase n=1 Tax=Saguinus oedipus TaxID=9490 RepID=A0ABQ9W9A6_SAGOE|nr:hypothetical protein P7K49_005088 [Saguinus oedipus]